MRDNVTNIRRLPTAMNVEQAFADYRTLVLASEANPSLRADLDHCQRTVRAWKVWFDMFLQMDAAA